VLRRILRRAARFGRNLDMHEPFIYKLVPVLVDIMGDAFPEIKEKHQFISMVVKSEEESFNRTLDRGLEIFTKIVADLEKDGQKEIPGEDAFRLYDTYGFPLDLTQLMARQQNLTVDEKGFESAMDEQRQRARKAGKWSYSADFDYKDWVELSSGEDSKFLGYAELECDAEIRKFKLDGDRIFLTLSQTPFYGEAGGQVGDVGEITGDGFKIAVEDTIRDGPTFVHIGKFIEGSKIDKPGVRAIVDKSKRKSTARNHTATHLLHKALRETLGTHVTQAGSLVAPDHLRFDVTHFQKISPQELEKIEARVNEKVREDLAVETERTTYVKAREMGAMAIFEEKYGENVRVVKIADFSMELCGGAHLTHTGEIGYFRILSESSAAAGIRRLEAVTGESADSLLRQEKALTHSLQEILNCSGDELLQKIQHLIHEKQRLEKDLKQFRVKSAQQDISLIVEKAQSLDGLKVVATQVSSDSVDELKQISDTLRSKLGSGIGVLGSVINGKASFICVVTDDLISGKNLKAGDSV
ncbi:MAG: alanine--tRNA ligase, partial [bacterium]